jgi:hypothetical protein
MNMNKKYILVTVVLVCAIYLISDDLEVYDHIDGESLINYEEYYEVEETEERDMTRSRSLEYTITNFVRYTERTENMRSLNTLRARNDIFDIRIYHEHNFSIDNTPLPVGASIKASLSPKSTLILGQYQISTGYGLLLSRGSMFSPTPGFSTSYRENRTTLVSVAGPYFSRSLFGVAYNHEISDNLIFTGFSSYKDTPVRLVDGKVSSLLVDERHPTAIAQHSFSGGVVTNSGEVLNISLAGTYSEIFRGKSDVAAGGVSRYNKYPISSSLALSYKYNDYFLYSETAHSNDKIGQIVGLQYSPRWFSHGLTYRYMQKGYEAPFSSFESNSSSGDNEHGLMYMVSIRNRDFMISTFGDFFSDIEPNDRYSDRNEGVSYGVRFEKYSLFGNRDMRLSLSYRQKLDKDWRNLTGVSRYENRDREYYRAIWTQTNTTNLRSRLTFDYNKREYPDQTLKSDGYALSQSVLYRSGKTRYSFTAGIFDSDIPLYLHVYSGSLNNPFMVFSGEGQYAMLHIATSIKNDISMELMYSFINRGKPESVASVMVRYTF